MSEILAGHGRIAIDTAPLIYFVEGDQGRAPIVRELIAEGLRGGVSLVVSAVTEAELLVAPLRRRDSGMATVIGRLLDGAGVSVAEVTRDIAQRAAAVRAEHRLRLMDALVVATALASRCTALLGNDEVFRRIGGALTYVHLDDLIERRAR